MGHESVVYGYIKGATLRPGPDFYALHPLNRAVIQRLPEDDLWPFLSGSMFTVPRDEPTAGRYRRQIIHFGASFKMIETDWEKWLDKFEHLLRQLYWIEAKVHLETEFLGAHLYVWKGQFEASGPYCTPPTPTTNWIFAGGPRKFHL